MTIFYLSFMVMCQRWLLYEACVDGLAASEFSALVDLVFSLTLECFPPLTGACALLLKTSPSHVNKLYWPQLQKLIQMNLLSLRLSRRSLVRNQGENSSCSFADDLEGNVSLLTCCISPQIAKLEEFSNVQVISSVSWDKWIKQDLCRLALFFHAQGRAETCHLSLNLCHMNQQRTVFVRKARKRFRDLCRVMEMTSSSNSRCCGLA